MGSSDRSRGRWEVGKSAKKPRNNPTFLADLGTQSLLGYPQLDAPPLGHRPTDQDAIVNDAAAAVAVTATTYPDAQHEGAVHHRKIDAHATTLQLRPPRPLLLLHPRQLDRFDTDPTSSPPSPKKRKASASLRAESSMQRSASDDLAHRSTAANVTSATEPSSPTSRPFADMLQQFGQIELNRDILESIKRTESATGLSKRDTSAKDAARAAFDAAVTAAKELVSAQIENAGRGLGGGGSGGGGGGGGATDGAGESEDKSNVHTPLKYDAAPGDGAEGDSGHSSGAAADVDRFLRMFAITALAVIAEDADSSEDEYEDDFDDPISDHEADDDDALRGGGSSDGEHATRDASAECGGTLKALWSGAPAPPDAAARVPLEEEDERYVPSHRQLDEEGEAIMLRHLSLQGNTDIAEALEEGPLRSLPPSPRSPRSPAPAVGKGRGDGSQKVEESAAVDRGDTQHQDKSTDNTASLSTLPDAPASNSDAANVKDTGATHQEDEIDDRCNRLQGVSGTHSTGGLLHDETEDVQQQQQQQQRGRTYAEQKRSRPGSALSGEMLIQKNLDGSRGGTSGAEATHSRRGDRPGRSFAGDGNGSTSENGNGDACLSAGSAQAEPPHVDVEKEKEEEEKEEAEGRNADIVRSHEQMRGVSHQGGPSDMERDARGGGVRRRLESIAPFPSPSCDDASLAAADVDLDENALFGDGTDFDGIAAAAAPELLTKVGSRTHRDAAGSCVSGGSSSGGNASRLTNDPPKRQRKGPGLVVVTATSPIQSPPYAQQVHVYEPMDNSNYTGREGDGHFSGRPKHQNQTQNQKQDQHPFLLGGDDVKEAPEGRHASGPPLQGMASLALHHRQDLDLYRLMEPEGIHGGGVAGQDDETMRKRANHVPRVNLGLPLLKQTAEGDGVNQPMNTVRMISARGSARNMDHHHHHRIPCLLSEEACEGKAAANADASAESASKQDAPGGRKQPGTDDCSPISPGGSGCFDAACPRYHGRHANATKDGGTAQGAFGKKDEYNDNGDEKCAQPRCASNDHARSSSRPVSPHRGGDAADVDADVDVVIDESDAEFDHGWRSSLVCPDVTLNDVGSKYWPGFRDGLPPGVAGKGGGGNAAGVGDKSNSQVPAEERRRLRGLAKALDASIVEAYQKAAQDAGHASRRHGRPSAAVRSLAAITAFDDLLRARLMRRQSKTTKVALEQSRRDTFVEDEKNE